MTTAPTLSPQTLSFPLPSSGSAGSVTETPVSLRRFCTQCGTARRQASRFCVQCGAAVGHQAVPAARGTTVAQVPARVGTARDEDEPTELVMLDVDEVRVGGELLATFHRAPVSRPGAWPAVTARGAAGTGVWTFIHGGADRPLTTTIHDRATGQGVARFTAQVGRVELVLADGRCFRWYTHHGERYSGELRTDDDRPLLRLTLMGDAARIEVRVPLASVDHALLTLVGLYLLLIRGWADRRRAQPRQ